MRETKVVLRIEHLRRQLSRMFKVRKRLFEFQQPQFTVYSPPMTYFLCFSLRRANVSAAKFNLYFCNTWISNEGPHAFLTEKLSGCRKRPPCTATLFGSTG